MALRGGPVGPGDEAVYWGWSSVYSQRRPLTTLSFRGVNAVHDDEVFLLLPPTVNGPQARKGGPESEGVEAFRCWGRRRRSRSRYVRGASFFFVSPLHRPSNFPSIRRTWEPDLRPAISAYRTLARDPRSRLRLRLGRSGMGERGPRRYRSRSRVPNSRGLIAGCSLLLGWVIASDSELARTRGIRLSN